MTTPTTQDYLLFDGAFGTYYFTLTNNKNFCEYANINDKDTVIKIHKEYIDAGAMAIKTNTFGANSKLVDDFAILDNIIRSGWTLAVLAATEGHNIQIFADIGPIVYEDAELCKQEYLRIAKIFLDCGTTNFIFETFPEYEILASVIAYIKKQVPEAFIIISFAVDQDGYTKNGLYYKDLIKSATQNSEVSASGLNCFCGPSHLYNLIKNLDIENATISAMPNAGYPSYVASRTVYIDNSEYFASKLFDIKNCGASILGGCCGTTPAHIRAASLRLSNKEYLQESESLSISPSNEKVPLLDKIQEIQASDFFASSGKMLIAVELDPPVDTNYELLLSGSIQVKNAGADIITFADSPLARVRADSIMIASKIKREVEIKVIPHLTCRDKNLIGIKASLLGGNIEGVRNILVVTGDPISQTDRSEIKGVFSLNSQNLIKYIDNLNNDVFADNQFCIGGALNVNAANFDVELKRAQVKLQNGAKYFLTQPVYDKYAIDNIKKARQYLNAKILCGIMPLASYKNAIFINNEVPGISIPEELINEFKGKSIDEVECASVDFCVRIAKLVKDYCDGFYLITPLKKTHIICKLIEELRREII